PTLPQRETKKTAHDSTPRRGESCRGVQVHQLRTHAYAWASPRNPRICVAFWMPLEAWAWGESCLGVQAHQLRTQPPTPRRGYAWVPG
ncbi:hypothetical protein PIB30_109503, partial [Stylosanthes scabra]|nr:hypothetical protein [Stylosanthes scabra]